MFDIKTELKKLPNKSGIYLMKNMNGEVIYVGKANILKNRVKQYFQTSTIQTSTKISALVSNITSFDYIITNSEMEALILESNLIKKYKPRYNVLLKDDKSFPYIKVAINEKFPRVFVTRKIIKDGAKYFGPYTNVRAVKNTLEMIKNLFQIRTCNRNLNKISRPCLNFHINKCLGPCNGKVNEKDYVEVIEDVIKFLNGSYKDIILKLEIIMKKYSDELKFEKAADIRDKIKSVEIIAKKQNINSFRIGDADVIASYKKDLIACIEVFFIRNGNLIGRENFSLDIDEGDKKTDIIAAFIKQFYSGKEFIPTSILIEEDIEEKDLLEEWLKSIQNIKVTIKVPKRGEKLDLINLVSKNAKESLIRFYDIQKKSDSYVNRAIEKLMEIGNLPKFPNIIEGYDISNTGDQEIVGSMVVFSMGVPDKKSYKRFKIKTIKTQDDYAAMKEMIVRRLKYLLSEKQTNNKDISVFSKPDLMLIDGSKGHVNMVKECLQIFNINIPVFGMVKDNKHTLKGILVNEQIIDLDNQDLFYLKKFIMSIQDEAHRFALDYNKILRKKRYNKSVLDDIKGIGKLKKKELIITFGSIDKISKASVEELTKVKGISKQVALKIREYFN